MKIKILFLLCFLFFNSLGSNLKKCNRKDIDFDKCFSEAIKEAMEQLTSPNRKFSVPVVDPLELPSLSIDAGSSAVHFTQNYKNMKIRGLSKVDLVNATIDFDKKFIKVNISCPEIILEFEYQIDGKILILPITGHGPGIFKLAKPRLLLTSHYEIYNKNGQEHMNVTRTDIIIDPEGLHYQFDNLFNGDKALSDNVNQVMNDNWREVFSDVRSGYEIAFAKLTQSIMNRVFGKMSVVELFDDTKK